MLHLDEKGEVRFLEDLVALDSYYRGRYPKVHALFCAIDSAFCGVDKQFMINTVPVKVELLQYLAICAKVALDPDKDGTIDFEIDGIFSRAVRAFWYTLKAAILERRNTHINAEGETLFGCFHIPQYLVEGWEQERDETTAHIRQRRAERPGSHLVCIARN